MIIVFSGYLRGLEMMQVPKNIRDDLGGGMKEFTLKEASSFQDIEEMNNFLTSQERQAIILHLLHSLRAEAGGDSVSKLRFREGEAISKFYFLFKGQIKEIYSSGSNDTHP